MALSVEWASQGMVYGTTVSALYGSTMLGHWEGVILVGFPQNL